MRSARELSPVVFDAAPLDILDSAFLSTAAAAGMELPLLAAAEAESSERRAAIFLIGLLRSNADLRRRFPSALGDGDRSGFARWLEERAPELTLSKIALQKIRGALRHRPGRRVYDIYLNDPELQKLYPLGLLPLGQLHFFSWLTTHGRRDQGLRNEEIHWFLQESAEEKGRGWYLTYLLQPKWQEFFPGALTPQGWKKFRQWLRASYGEGLTKTLPSTVPSILSKADQRSLECSQRDGPQSRGVEGVNMLSHFCNPSGLQQAALWTKEALERKGVRTSCRDVPVPRRVLARDRDEWLGLEIFPITILNHGGIPYFLSGYERSGLFRREGVFRVAYWSWELETVPDEWLKAAELVDEIWSPTEFVVKAMRSRISRPVYDMLPGVEIGEVEPISRSSLGIPEHHLVFLFVFDLHSQLHRKNPIGVLRAFQNAFREDDAVTLVIKATGGDIFSDDLALLRATVSGKNIILLEDLLPRARAYGLIAMSDCFVSLHRSEGFGLGLAEAMLMGKPVIATGYSGNLAFMNRDNSVLVDYKIVDIAEDRPLYTKGNFWADPSIEHAAACMRQVYEHRDEARERAVRVQPEVQRLLSLATAGQRMHERLTQIQALR